LRGRCDCRALRFDQPVQHRYAAAEAFRTLLALALVGEERQFRKAGDLCIIVRSRMVLARIVRRFGRKRICGIE
jgi:hypothetical protein